MPRKKSTYLVILVAVVVFPGLDLARTSVASMLTVDLTIEPQKPQVKVNNTIEIRVKATESLAIGDATWTGGEGILEIGSNRQVDDTTIATPIKALSFSPSPTTITISAKGNMKSLQITTLLSEANFPPDPADTFTLSQDSSQAVRLTRLDPATTLRELLELSTDTDSASLRIVDTSLIVTGRSPGTSRVTIKNKMTHEALKTYEVTVSEIANAIQTNMRVLHLTVGDEFDLSSLNTKVIGKSHTDLTQTFQPSYDTNDANIVKVTGTKLKALRTLRVGEVANLMITAGGVTQAVPIDITAATKDIILTPSSSSRSVRVGQTTRIDAQVRNSDNELLTTPDIEWTVSSADQQFVDLQPHGSYVVVVGKNPHAGVVITGKLRNSDKQQAVSLDVKSNEVEGFTLLRIRVDLLDSQTAKDLFGKKAADEFYIAKIRLFNKLKNSDGESADSILVYSESLELNVQLQKRNASGGWDTVGRDEYVSLFGPYDGSSDTVRRRRAENGQCLDQPQPGFIAYYRPYTFDVVANTHDRRDERSARSRILLVANGLSSLASFVTAIAVPPSSSDLPLGLDKFKNLLIPSFERLFPSMKEVQRQNIITMVMKPLEEIPFGSDVTRILFIPKGKLIGMISKQVFRIGAISTTGHCAEVGIIKKTTEAPLVP